MKKRILVAVGILLAIFLSLLIGHTALVLNPGLLFKHEKRMGQFLALSSEPIDSRLDPVVASAHAIIADSELYNPNDRMRIVLSHSHFYNELTGMLEMAYSNGSNAILAGMLDFDSNSLYTEKSSVRMNLITTLAHELTHCIQRKRHGMHEFENSVPLWKKEGYAEYVSQRDFRTSHNYSLRESIGNLLENQSLGPIKGWLTTEDGYHRPAMYYRFRLMTEFLFDVKRYSYEKYMGDEVGRDDVYADMIAWYKVAPEATESVR